MSARLPAYDGDVALLLPSGAASPVAEALRVLRRHRLLFVLVAVCVVAAATAVTLSLTPKYTATAVIAGRSEAPDPLSPVGSSSAERPEDSPVDINAAMLKSRDLAERVVERFGIGASDQVKPPAYCAWVWIAPLCQQPPRPLTMQERVDGFLAGVEVAATARSRVLSVSYTSSDPRLAADAVNFLVIALQQEQLAARTADLMRTAKWLEARSEELRTRWLSAERRAGQSRASGDMAETVAAQGSEPLIVRQIANAANEASQVRAQLAAAEARAAALDKAARAGDRLRLVRLSEEPLVIAAATALNTLQSNRAQIAQRYGARHPSTVALDGQIAEAEQRLAAEGARALRAINDDVAVKRTQLARSEENLAALRARAGASGSQAVESRSLDRDAASARSIYEMFLERAKQVADRTAILQPSVQFISRADVPGRPSYPKTQRFLLGGLVLGLTAAAAAAFVREHFQTGLSNISRVSEQLALPLLATVPTVPLRRRLRTPLDRYTIEYPFSFAAEAVRSLAAHTILARGVGEGTQSLLLTSAMSGEGKSTLSRWLAGAVAQAGRSVLVIDGDHRKNPASRSPRIGPGLTDLLMGRAAFDQTVQHDRSTGIDFIPAGAPMLRPFGRAELENLRVLVEQAKRHYSLVLIDAPPLLAMAEGLLYASVADQTVLVCRWQYTSRSAVLSCIERLRATGTTLTGVVLSMVDTKAMPLYSDDYRPRDVKLISQRYHVG